MRKLPLGVWEKTVNAINAGPSISGTGAFANNLMVADPIRLVDARIVIAEMTQGIQPGDWHNRQASAVYWSGTENEWNATTAPVYLHITDMMEGDGLPVDIGQRVLLIEHMPSQRQIPINIPTTRLIRTCVDTDASYPGIYGTGYGSGTGGPAVFPFEHVTCTFNDADPSIATSYQQSIQATTLGTTPAGHVYNIICNWDAAVGYMPQGVLAPAFYHNNKWWCNFVGASSIYAFELAEGLSLGGSARALVLNGEGLVYSYAGNEPTEITVTDPFSIFGVSGGGNLGDRGFAGYFGRTGTPGDAPTYTVIQKICLEDS